MKIKPPNDKLLVELIIEEVTTASGLIITDMGRKVKNSDEPHPHSIHLAKVVAVGVDAKQVKAGDKLLVEYCFTRPFSFQDMEYKIIKESDIVGVVDEDTTETEE